MIKNRAIIDDIEVNGKQVRFEFAVPMTWEEVMQAAEILHSKGAEQIEMYKTQQEAQEVKVEEIE